MQAKMFEIRDRMTFIPALAIRLDPTCDQERRLLSRAGYGPDAESQAGYLILVKVNDVEAQSDQYAWRFPRTMPTAHKFILDNWEELKTGEVVDVEFILGETATKKESEFSMSSL